MAAGKEIRTKISSIRSTQKITSAMQMVAASKMRRAQDRMRRGKPYARRMRAVVGHIANAVPEYQHMYMKQREIRRVGFLVVSTDRGLCGGLNINLFKRTVRAMKEWADQGVEIELSLIGAKAAAFFNSYGGNVTSAVRDVGETPALADLIGSVKTMLDAYAAGHIDRLFLVSNQFVNTMTQNPTVEQLLPLEAEDNQEMKHHWDYIYEPDSKAILESLLMRFIESQVYQRVIENIACENSARMVAMKSATDNAGDLIKNLQTIYNKARQAAITQEISEIVAGAAAV
jgi:F-type H+-transporting ATPase subunit gamma